MGAFKRFFNRLQPRQMGPYDRLLVDPTNGNPMGIQNPNANGDDGYFYPVPLTQAQLAAPPQEVINNVDVTYRLSVAPYTRYRSDGVDLIPLGSNLSEVQNQILYGPVTLLTGMLITGQVRVYAWPT